MSAPDYLRLDGGAKYRMLRLRDRAIHTGKPTWREARSYGFHNWAAAHGELSQGYNGDENNKTPIWYCHTGEQFRDERDCHMVDGAYIDHVGWFTSNHCEDRAVGIVGRLTHGRYIAGYRWTSNGERVYFGDVYTDEIEAARAADRHAESFADMAREDAEKYDEARKLENVIDDKLRRLRECIALRHKARMPYARDEARELIGQIRADRDRLQTDYSDYL